MLKINNLHKSFGELVVIDNLSLQVNNEEFVCIIGPSGCGKTTLLNIITGVQKADSGEIITSCEKLSVVFQEDRLLEWETVLQNVKSVGPDGSDNRAHHFLELCGLKGYEHYFPKQLSGGMRQRVSIARSLYFSGDLLLLDEPFKSLDFILKTKMLKDLKEIQRIQKNSILMITHDIEEAFLVADKIFVFQKNPCRIAQEYDVKSIHLDGNSKEKIKEEVYSMVEN